MYKSVLIDVFSCDPHILSRIDLQRLHNVRLQSMKLPLVTCGRITRRFLKILVHTGGLRSSSLQSLSLFRPNVQSYQPNFFRKVLTHLAFCRFVSCRCRLNKMPVDLADTGSKTKVPFTGRQIPRRTNCHKIQKPWTSLNSLFLSSTWKCVQPQVTQRSV